MPGHRVLKSVARSFLDSFTSRNADLGGYWLFGQLPQDFEQARFDLLAPPRDPGGPVATAHVLAARRLAEILEHSGLTPAVLTSATLDLVRLPDPLLGPRGTNVIEGREFRLRVRATVLHGQRYEDECRLFVAPHDPTMETRRSKTDWGP